MTATEANQRFSELLRDVSEGHSVTITSRGTPVAQMIPAAQADRKRSVEDFMTFLESQPVIRGKKWTREELYDRSDRNLP